MLFGHVLFALCGFDDHLGKFFHSLETDPFRHLIKVVGLSGNSCWKLEAAEVLPVAVFDELVHYRFVAHVVSMLEVVVADQGPDWQTGTAKFLDVQGAEFFVKYRPVDGIRQMEQRMPAVEDPIQPGAEQIALVNGA
jgi:hypothetical protein